MSEVFGGLVFIWYVIAHYLVEGLFVFAVVAPFAFSVMCVIIFGFGRYGKIIRSAKNSVRFAHKGIIVAENRGIFYEKCIKHTSRDFKSAYSAYLKGEINITELANSQKPLLKGKKQMLLGGYTAITTALGVLCFSIFYLTAPISECIMRTAFIAFFAFLGKAILFFAIYGYDLTAKKYTFKLCDMIENCIPQKTASTESPLSTRARAINNDKANGDFSDLKTTQDELTDLKESFTDEEQKIIKELRGIFHSNGVKA